MVWESLALSQNDKLLNKVYTANFRYQYTIPFCTISWCQHWRSRTQKITQYGYVSFLPDMFLENVIFQPQCSVHRQSVIVWYVFWLLDTMRTYREQQLGSCHGIFSAVLARMCHVKMSACTQLPFLAGANLLAGRHTPPFTAVTTKDKPLPLPVSQHMCMPLIGNNPNAPPFPTAGGVKWASCFVLTASYTGVAHLLIVAVLKHYAIGKQRASQATGAPHDRRAPASHAATILAKWACQNFSLKFPTQRSCRPRPNLRNTNISLPKPQENDNVHLGPLGPY